MVIYTYFKIKKKVAIKLPSKDRESSKNQVVNFYTDKRCYRVAKHLEMKEKDSTEKLTQD